MRVVLSVVVAVLPLAAAFSVPKIASTPSRPSFVFALNAELNGGLNGEAKKKVMVLGGDGFCGWPTSLYLSDQGHDIVVVDNLSRRKIDLDLGCDSLTPISSMEVRRCLRRAVGRGGAVLQAVCSLGVFLFSFVMQKMAT